MRTPCPPLFAVAALVASLVAGCERPQIQPQVAPGKTLESLTVTSKTFTHGGRIPIDATCDGKDKMPDLTWSAPPEGTQSLVVIVEDPDASSSNFVHLLVYDLPAEVHTLAGEELQGGGIFGLNDFRATRYNGPCPPKGEAHRYRFRVVALDVKLAAREGLTRAELDRKMDGHLLAEGSLTGIFGH